MNNKIIKYNEDGSVNFIITSPLINNYNKINIKRLYFINHHNGYTKKYFIKNESYNTLFIHYNSDNVIKQYGCYKKVTSDYTTYHNINGPAYASSIDDIGIEYYVDGKYISNNKKDFKKYINNLNLT